MKKNKLISTRLLFFIDDEANVDIREELMVVLHIDNFVVEFGIGCIMSMFNVYENLQEI